MTRSDQLAQRAVYLTWTAREVWRQQQLYTQDRAMHIPVRQSAAFEVLSAEKRQSVGAAWAEALNGAAEMRRQLARPFDPGRIDHRDKTRGMPWEMVTRLPGSDVSTMPVFTAHMYRDNRRNGRDVYQPGASATVHLDMVAERMSK